MQYTSLKSAKDRFVLILAILMGSTTTYVILFPLFQSNPILNNIMLSLMAICWFSALIFLGRKNECIYRVQACDDIAEIISTIYKRSEVKTNR